MAIAILCMIRCSIVYSQKTAISWSRSRLLWQNNVLDFYTVRPISHEYTKAVSWFFYTRNLRLGKIVEPYELYLLKHKIRVQLRLSEESYIRNIHIHISPKTRILRCNVVSGESKLNIEELFHMKRQNWLAVN